MNRLYNEKSVYLRHSAYQKIDWYPWSEEAFERAKREDKPVFLSSGAAWCHWCHVMAEECFEDEDIARILNENFINIKLDRDERPEIDRRFQQAVAAMGRGGGWPLSVFLTPDKKPFFGGTYFPPEDRQDIPGFKKVLAAVSDFYRSKRKEISEYTEKLIDSLRPKPLHAGELRKSIIDDAVSLILSEFDPQNGGFGTQPKFPMPGAIEFLLNRYFFTRSETVKLAVKKTLESMAKGGFHDQIGGGFHRYSTDGAWIMPHFEKMADDNAWLLRNYIDACFVFEDEYFREVAEGITGFIKSELSGSGGGFFASQDADVTPDDEGGYFTWTDEDLRRVLDGEEYEVLSLHLFHERGSMHHDKKKRVLFVAAEAKDIAGMLGREAAEISGIISRGKKKLLEERTKRKKPQVDKTLYTSLNAMLASSFIRAYRVLGDRALMDFALTSLEKVMRENFAGGRLFHSEGAKAVLEDYIYLTDAFIAAYEVSGNKSYSDTAQSLMEACLGMFWDSAEGGFFDTEEEVLGTRLKGIEDIPHPSAGSLGIMLLLKFNFLTGRDDYLHHAETALKVFSSGATEMGIHSGYYYCALDAYFNMFGLAVESEPGSRLAEAALSCTVPYTAITYGKDRGQVIPCIRGRCYEPIDDTAKIKLFLEHPS